MWNNHLWLVVGPPLRKIWKSIGMIIPNIYIWENKTCSKSPTRSINARFSIGEISNQKRPTLERESVDHHVKWCVAVTDWIHFKKWGNSGDGYNPCISYRSITALGGGIVSIFRHAHKYNIVDCSIHHNISHSYPMNLPLYPHSIPAKLKPILQRVQDMVLFSRKFSTKVKSC